MCRAATPAQLGSAVMLLAHLANCQEHFKALPPKGFKQLAKVGRGLPILFNGHGSRVAAHVPLAQPPAMETPTRLDTGFAMFVGPRFAIPLQSNCCVGHPCCPAPPAAGARPG